MASPQPTFQAALLAGALAGTTVDLSLFPLDTLKTRLQAREGFFASGGFKGIYRGIGSTIVGSAPGAALFFCTYEATKTVLLAREGPSQAAPNAGANALHHMLAASLGEIAACAVRVPTEVVKQRAQAGMHGGSSVGALRAMLSMYRGDSGGNLHTNTNTNPVVGVARVWRELYRGWGITIMREVPFTVIQFPLWEAMKAWGRERRQRRRLQQAAEGGGAEAMTREQKDVSALESAVYGSISGAVAAGLTTPLDVLKTRVMLAPSGSRVTVLGVLRAILRDEGVKSLFAGIGPRTLWISIGGAVFLGSYTWAANLPGRLCNWHAKAE